MHYVNRTFHHLRVISISYLANLRPLMLNISSMQVESVKDKVMEFLQVECRVKRWRVFSVSVL